MKTAAATLLALLVLAAPAHAAGHFPVVAADVQYAPCPNAQFANAAGCTWQGATVVYVNPAPILGGGDDYRAFTTYHELGHQFAFRVLGPGGLHKFARMTRHAHDQGARSKLDVSEEFADAYATCALGYVPRPDAWSADGADSAGNFPTGYGYEPSPHVQRSVCAFIRRAGRRAGL